MSKPSVYDAPREINMQDLDVPAFLRRAREKEMQQK
jgi:hypothetical protein